MMNSHAVSTSIIFKELHRPGAPIVLANVWDTTSLHAVLSLNTVTAKPVRAVATASWAIAASLGITDEELSAEQNLDAIARLAPTVKAAGLPLTVDLQDGYGDRIDEVVASAIMLGACGANIEDSIPSSGFGRGIEGSLYGMTEQTARLKGAIAAAARGGCPDFVVNARCDVFRLEPPFPESDTVALDEAVRRGRSYLDAGATTVFFWGGKRGLSRAEVEILTREMGGRIAVKLSDRAGQNPGLTVEELAALGVSRISIGPTLYLIATAAMREATQRILSGGRLGG